AIRLQDIPVVCLWPRSFSQPPDMFYRVLHPNSSYRHPFSRHRELCWIVPKELLRQVKAQGFDQFDKKLVQVDRTGRESLVIAPTDVQHKTPIILKHPMELARKL